jgi:hypothetical protein
MDGFICGQTVEKRETDRGPIFGSQRAAPTKCIFPLPMPLETDFVAWTMQNGFGCRNRYPVGDSLTVCINVVHYLWRHVNGLL